MRKAIYLTLLAIAGVLVFQWSKPVEISPLREVKLVTPETLEVAAPIVSSAPVMGGDVEAEVDPPLGAPDLLEVGEPIDPDDPESWAVYAESKPISIGDPLDPDDPESWEKYNDLEKKHVGEPLDPADPSSYLNDNATELISVGEPMEPEDLERFYSNQPRDLLEAEEPLSPR